MRSDEWNWTSRDGYLLKCLVHWWMLTLRLYLIIALYLFLSCVSWNKSCAIKPVNCRKFLSHKNFFFTYPLFPSVLPLRMRCRKSYLGSHLMCPRYYAVQNSLLCPILSRTTSFFILQFHEIFRSLLYNHISDTSILFIVSVVNIHICSGRELIIRIDSESFPWL